MNHHGHNPHHPEDQQPADLDRLLDDSLAQYSQAEPLAGLEDRILARLERAPKEPREGFSWAAIAAWFTPPRLAGAATALLLAGGIWLGVVMVTAPGEDIDYVGQDTTVDVKGGTPVETAIAPLPVRIPQEAFRASAPRIAEIFAATPVFKLGEEPTVRIPHSPAKDGREVAVSVVVKEEVFPAPAPLSEQESLALAYARMSQRTEVASSLPEDGVRKLEVELLELAPIKVEELERPAAEVRKDTDSR